MPNRDGRSGLVLFERLDIRFLGSLFSTYLLLSFDYRPCNKAIVIIICMLCLCIYIWGFAYYLVIVLLNSLIKTLYVFF
jgi:hypothetical protein